jgi:hypothetical protein
VSGLTDNGERASKAKQALTRIVGIVATIVAVALTTSIAYLVFEGGRQTPLDNIMNAIASSMRSVVKAVVNLDPVAAAWIFPLLLGAAAVIGMLIWRRFDR